MIGWTHPIDESDQWDGFNEPGIEHFSGSPIRHLAREVVQNSLDSHNETTTKPVRVTFKEHSIKTSEIPDVVALKSTMQRCLSSAEDESTKAKQFFETALKELDKPKIKVLEICDFNTKGMRGPVKNGTAYFAFMKAKGQSKKASDTAAGSFGIGKFAPYAVSKLRTVFVSTVFEDDSSFAHQYTQGKSILMSHDDADGNRHQGVGFWGITEKCQPILGFDSNLPGWVVRTASSKDAKDHVGTKLIILGFDANSGWEESLAASIVENFFGAIHSGKLEVDIQTKYHITSSNLAEIFASEDILKAIEQEKDEPDQFKNSRAYHDCIIEHAEAYIETTQNLNLGLCELKILPREGLPKKVAFLRNGMFISDSLNLPGLKNFSEFKDFVAVFNCRDSKGIELLRAMEPPRHDDFEPDRLPTKDEQQKARRALREMAGWIRDMLRRRAKDPVSEITRIDELKEFFADESTDGKGSGIEEVNPFGTVSIKAKPVSYKKSPPIGTGGTTGTKGVDSTDGDGGGGSEGEGGGDSSGGAGTSSGGSGGSDSTKPPAPISNPRAVVLTTSSRKLAFTPLTDATYEVALYESGADSEYPVSILSSTGGEVVAGKVKISAKKNQRLLLDVLLAEEFSGALKVVAHEVR
jgi:uncharacterized membrane protein YgcG